MFDIHRIGNLTVHGATWILWLLALLSILGVAIAVERAIVLVSSRDDFTRLRRELRRLLDRGDRVAALKCLEASPSYEARVAAAGLRAEGSASAEERMAGEQQLMRLNMEHNLAFLGTLGNNAPFIGLLGTVIGIIRAFHELDRTRGQLSMGLMTEIGEALVATAVGLLVALPAIAAFNLFQRVIKARAGRADALGREILAYLKADRTAEGE
jgi:biopolymer transport protein ExbB